VRASARTRIPHAILPRAQRAAATPDPPPSLDSYVLPFCIGAPALASALRCWGMMTKRPRARDAIVAGGGGREGGRRGRPRPARRATRAHRRAAPTALAVGPRPPHDNRGGGVGPAPARARRARRALSSTDPGSPAPARPRGRQPQCRPPWTRTPLLHHLPPPMTTLTSESARGATERRDATRRAGAARMGLVMRAADMRAGVRWKVGRVRGGGVRERAPDARLTRRRRGPAPGPAPRRGPTGAPRGAGPTRRARWMEAGEVGASGPPRRARPRTRPPHARKRPPPPRPARQRRRPGRHPPPARAHTRRGRRRRPLSRPRRRAAAPRATPATRARPTRPRRRSTTRPRPAGGRARGGAGRRAKTRDPPPNPRARVGAARAAPGPPRPTGRRGRGRPACGACRGSTRRGRWRGIGGLSGCLPPRARTTPSSLLFAPNRVHQPLLRRQRLPLRPLRPRGRISHPPPALGGGRRAARLGRVERLDRGGDRLARRRRSRVRRPQGAQLLGHIGQDEARGGHVGGQARDGPRRVGRRCRQPRRHRVRAARMLPGLVKHA